MKWITLALIGSVQAAQPCRIEVTDSQNHWPVPMVELRTTSQLRFVTDNAGVITFDAPELMGKLAWFQVIGHGYGVKADGFGYEGVKLTPQPGQTLRIEVERNNIAKRIGRLTGSGLFAESQKLGERLDWEESGIVGCDSIQTAVHRGKHFWAWGDTNIASYPLGNFHMTSATTSLQPFTRYEPPLEPKFDYFRNEKGGPRGVAKMPGEGPTWVTGYTSLPDKAGTPHLVGAYMKIKPPMNAYEWGLCEWNEKTQEFDLLKVIWHESTEKPKPPPVPEGHPIVWKDHLYFGNPLPTLRCPATFEAWQDPASWEVLTPQESLEPKVKPHTGSIAWNVYRQRWVTVFMEKFGKPSAFGELWYAEAKEPTGPWGPAVKILTHANYTFYNPRIHPEFTAPDSPILLFEGTYTKEFANHAAPTPRYDYNQILYRLDLDDPKLKDAQP